jgi:hypothetical protein
MITIANSKPPTALHSCWFPARNAGAHQNTHPAPMPLHRSLSTNVTCHPESHRFIYSYVLHRHFRQARPPSTPPSAALKSP